jgi:putative transposase
LTEQLKLACISKTAYYYTPISETKNNLLYMEIIDREYTEHPFFGSRQMMFILQRQGYQVNRKRVMRLMQKMGLKAIYRKPNLSKTEKLHKKYPYLLKGKEILEPNQVWATDITYIPIKGGFLYLVAIMDWATRYILSWKLSNTMDVGFCIEALKEALEYGTPEVFNSDQGSQFTSLEFTKILEENEIQISMDGKGRCYDNIFIERLWRSVKYEEVYLKKYENGQEAHRGLKEYLLFYNEKRPHQSLGGQTPYEKYYKKEKLREKNGRCILDLRKDSNRGSFQRDTVKL